MRILSSILLFGGTMIKFTKKEISLCKQVAEKHRKEIDEGDWGQINGETHLFINLSRCSNTKRHLTPIQTPKHQINTHKTPHVQTINTIICRRQATKEAINFNTSNKYPFKHRLGIHKHQSTVQNCPNRTQKSSKISPKRL